MGYFVSPLSGNVGINTTVPLHTLHIHQGESSTHTLCVNGMLGIGTSATKKVHVVGTIKSTIMSGALNGSVSSTESLANERFIAGKRFNGTADVALESLSLGNYVTGTSYNGNSASSITVNGTSLNTPSTLVVRDGAGNVATNILSGSLLGSASTTSAFASLSTIGGKPFNGTQNVDLALLSIGSYLTTTGATSFNGASSMSWSVDGTSLNTASQVVIRDVSGNVATNVLSATLFGNALTSDAFANTINIVGQPFNGTQSVTLSPLSAGTYLTAIGGSSYQGSVPSEWTVNGSSTNMSNTVVLRNASGSVFAGAIHAANLGIGTATVLGSIHVDGNMYVSHNIVRTEHNAGTNAAIDWTNGSFQTLTLDASKTLSLSNPAGVGWYQLRVLQDAVGGRNLSFGTPISGTRWLGTAAAPSVTFEANAETRLLFYYDGSSYVQTFVRYS